MPTVQSPLYRVIGLQKMTLSAKCVITVFEEETEFLTVLTNLNFCAMFKLLEVFEKWKFINIVTLLLT